MIEKDIFIDPDKDNAVQISEFVYLKLFHDDDGRIEGRGSLIQFKNRSPYCIRDYDGTQLVLDVTNSGHVASDVVMLELLISYTWSDASGDVVNFWLENETRSLVLPFIAASSTLPVHIKLKEALSSDLKTVSLSGRVTTLWSKILESSEWDFETDPAVTEWEHNF